jgi:hypothetical protein
MTGSVIPLAVEWFNNNGPLVVVLLGVSTLTFLAGLVLVPWLIVRIPADYFVRPRPPQLAWQRRHPVLRWSWRIFKNALGVALLAGGLVMLFTPGPGLISIFVGISLLDLPYKRAMEQRLISQPVVHRAINRMRAKYGRPPLELPQEIRPRRHRGDRGPTAPQEVSLSRSEP